MEVGEGVERGKWRVVRKEWWKGVMEVVEGDNVKFGMMIVWRRWVCVEGGRKEKGRIECGRGRFLE